MISIITPLLNEQEYIGPFLDHVGMLDGDFELILVDGGSSDHTLEEVDKRMKEFGHKISLLKTDRGRARQMNRGAEKARGDVLLFLHADCFIPRDTLVLIEKEKIERKTVGGGLKQTFQGSDVFLRFVSVFGNLQCRLTRTFFGDFGIFLSKSLFEKIGGYSDVPFLEDVEICRTAKKYGELRQIDRHIFTSPRRYISKGKCRLTTVFILACLFDLLGHRPRFCVNYLIDR